MRAGIVSARPAPGVYSAKVQNGGMHRDRSVVGQVPVQEGYVGREGLGGTAQQGYVAQVPVQQQQQGYGTVH